MKKINPTLVELWIGSALFSVTALLAGIWFVENKLAYVLGLLAGLVASMYLAWHMAKSIEKMLNKALEGFDGGVGMRVSSLLRYGIVILLLVVAAFVPEYLNPISVFIGIFGLKVAAYLQPFTHKIVFKLFGFEEEICPELPDTEEE